MKKPSCILLYLDIGRKTSSLLATRTFLVLLLLLLLLILPTQKFVRTITRKRFKQSKWNFLRVLRVTQRGAIDFLNFQDGRHFQDGRRWKFQPMSQISATPTAIWKKIGTVIQWTNLSTLMKKNRSWMTPF